MAKCKWCGAEVEKDKLFAHKWEKHRTEMLDQRRKQGATRGKKAKQSWKPLRQIWCRQR
jgi:hypothetical protein